MRRLIGWGVSVAVACLLAIAVFFFWLLATTEGTRWLWSRLSHAAPAVAVGEIHGCLWGELLLQGIVVRHPDWEIGVSKATVSWSPLQLAFGRLAVNSLSLEGVSWDKKTVDKKPLDLTWPTVPTLLNRFWGGVKLLNVERVIVRRPGQPPLEMGSLRGSVDWRFGTVFLKNVEAQSALGTLTGSLGAGFAKPALFGDIVFKPKEAVEKLDRFQVLLKTLPPASGEQTAGEVTLTAYGGATSRYTGKGRLALGRDRIAFQDLLLTEKGRDGMAALSGEISLSGPEPAGRIQIALRRLALEKNRRAAPVVSGTLNLSGSASGYDGRFSIAHSRGDLPWASGELQGHLRGNDRELFVREATGRLLGGRIGGEAQWTWGSGHRLRFFCWGRQLDPARLFPDWSGRLQIQGKGDVTFGLKPLEGRFSLVLQDSVLSGKTLSGQASARWENGRLTLERSELRGPGFVVAAEGALERRLLYSATVHNVRGLYPKGAGQCRAEGWVRRVDGQWSGYFQGRGTALTLGGVEASSIEAEGHWQNPERDTVDLRLAARRATFGALRLDRTNLTVRGTVSNHTLQVAAANRDGSLSLSLQGGYSLETWTGRLQNAVLEQDGYGTFHLLQPASLSLSRKRITASPLSFAGPGRERLSLEGDLMTSPPGGSLLFQWQGLNLARANAFLADEQGRVTGEVTGTFQAAFLDKEHLRFHGFNKGNLAWNKGAFSLSCPKIALDLKGDEKGIEGAWTLEMAPRGRISGSFASTVPIAVTRPDAGRLECAWESIDVVQFKPFFGKGIDLAGSLKGRLDGRIQGKHLKATGEVQMEGGRFFWRQRGRRVEAAIPKASLSLAWQGSTLSGQGALDLAERGHARGSFVLPIPAVWPVNVQTSEALQMEVRGRLYEKGILSALFPGIVEETRGLMEFDMDASGSWKKPHWRGQARLSGAGAYVPAAGIRLDDVKASVNWFGDRLELDSLSIRSGNGVLTGRGKAWFPGGGIPRYEGTLKGERFPIVYIPELRLWASPALRFSGTPSRIIVRGRIDVPEALVQPGDNKGAVRPSRDAVVTDRPRRAANRENLALDAVLTVALGEKVRVKALGLTGRLRGEALLRADNLENIRLNGQVALQDGNYERYGVNLRIVRGLAVFKDEPLERGSLDILAMKKIQDGNRGDVEAGVMITGNVSTPHVRLYGRPAMSDRDVISYLVVGRPYREDTGGGQKEQMAQWAAAVLAGSPSSSLTRQIQDLLGIDRIGIESDKTGEMSRSLITIGKYLSPDLYISFGRSLFGDDYYISTRYSFLKNWQIESRVGMQSGADIYYRIEFD